MALEQEIAELTKVIRALTSVMGGYHEEAVKMQMQDSAPVVAPEPAVIAQVEVTTTPAASVTYDEAKPYVLKLGEMIGSVEGRRFLKTFGGEGLTHIDPSRYADVIAACVLAGVVI